MYITALNAQNFKEITRKFQEILSQGSGSRSGSEKIRGQDSDPDPDPK